MIEIGYILTVTGLCFLLGSLLFPGWIKWSIQKKFYAQVTWRSAHKRPVPSTGGAIFTMALFCIPFIVNFNSQQTVAILITYLALIIGWVDDRKDLKWYFKLGMQFGIGSLFYVIDIKFIDLHGLLWIDELTPVSSYMLTVLLVMVLMNAINLIDGVDGLVGMISVIVCAFFSFWFVMKGNLFLGIYAGALVGLTLAFLRHNFSPANVFMGDAGTLFLGANFSLFIIVFMNESVTDLYVVPIGLILLPVIDMARMFLSRLLNGKSPFSPDKGHFHHLLIDTGAGHQIISIYGLTITIFLGGYAYMMTSFLGLNTAFLNVVGITIVIYAWINMKRIKYAFNRIRIIKKQVSNLTSNNHLLNHTYYEK